MVNTCSAVGVLRRAFQSVTAERFAPSIPATSKGRSEIMTDSPIKIAVLDDYQNIALKMADWSSISGNPEIKVFNDHISELEPLVERLYEIFYRDSVANIKEWILENS
jgi:hypothetical protein